MHIASWSLTTLPQVGHWRRTSSRSERYASATKQPDHRHDGADQDQMKNDEPRMRPDDPGRDAEPDRERR